MTDKQQHRFACWFSVFAVLWCLLSTILCFVWQKYPFVVVNAAFGLGTLYYAVKLWAMRVK